MISKLDSVAIACCYLVLKALFLQTNHDPGLVRILENALVLVNPHLIFSVYNAFNGCSRFRLYVRWLYRHVALAECSVGSKLLRCGNGIRPGLFEWRLKFLLIAFSIECFAPFHETELWGSLLKDLDRVAQTSHPLRCIPGPVRLASVWECNEEPTCLQGSTQAQRHRRALGSLQIRAMLDQNRDTNGTPMTHEQLLMIDDQQTA